MTLSTLTLTAFRVYRKKAFALTAPLTIFLGDNAVGKTTILEAIYLIATGESFRAGRTDEMIQFDEELSRVQGEVGHDTIEVILTRGLVQGKKTPSRIFLKNGVKKQKRKVIGSLAAVIFRPEDMRLIEGSPTRRRQFLDAPLKMLYPEYEHALSTYEQALKRKNKLLPLIKEGKAQKTVLHFWNQALVKHGTKLQRYRGRLLEFFSSITFPLNFRGEYHPSVISDDRQQEYLEREIAAGKCLIGPQKDDISVTLPIGREFRNVGVFGSRGQQRMAVLWLKFCELAFVRENSEQQPLLLLDDILSELDQDMRKLVISVTSDYQTILTTAVQSAVDEVLQLQESDLVVVHSLSRE